jgi:hypothetical protein
MIHVASASQPSPLDAMFDTTPSLPLSEPRGSQGSQDGVATVIDRSAAKDDRRSSRRDYDARSTGVNDPNRQARLLEQSREPVRSG